jgi:hypothetical protein
LPELINAAVTGEYTSTRWAEPIEHFKTSHSASIEDVEEFRATAMAGH